MTEIANQVYPRPIRIMHWLVVALIVVQLLSSEFMEEFFRRAENLPLGTLPDNAGAILHVLGGASILILMISRFVVRMKRGTPPTPHDLPAPLRVLARVNHFAFYVTLVLLPLTGVAAVFFARDLGDVHETLVTVLYVLIGLHVAGVLFHMLVLRDGALWRMLQFSKDAEGDRAAR